MRRPARRRLVFPLVALSSILATLFGAAALHAQEKVKLRFAGRWVAGSHEASYQAFAQAIAAYQKLHPDVEIEYIGEGGHDQYLEKLLVMGAAEGFPDIMHLYNPWVPDLLAKGLKFEAVPGPLRRRLEQGAFPAALGLTTYDGRLLGIPTENQIDALVWNKQIFAEAGVARPPDTWRELASLAQRLTKRDAQGAVQQTGFVVEGWDWAVQYLAMLIADGGAYLDASGRVAFGESKGLQTLQRLVEWRNDLGFFSTSRGLFDQRKAAMGVMFPWARFGLANTFKEQMASDVGVTRVPAGDVRRAAYHYGWGMYVPESGKHRDEAWRFLEFLALSREGREITFLGQALAGIGSLPTLRDDIQSSRYRADQAFYGGFVQNFDFAVSEPKLPEGQRRMSILTGELNAALGRSKSPVQALKDAGTQIQAILDRYR